MKNTAMQQIIERAEAGIKVHQSTIKNPQTSNIERNRSSHLLSVCEMFKQLAIELLVKEKQQLRDFWVEGNRQGWDQQTDWPEDADVYYNETFQSLS